MESESPEFPGLKAELHDYEQQRRAMRSNSRDNEDQLAVTGFARRCGYDRQHGLGSDLPGLLQVEKKHLLSVLSR